MSRREESTLCCIELTVVVSCWIILARSALDGGGSDMVADW
jgi:hypothetical protein